MNNRKLLILLVLLYSSFNFAGPLNFWKSCDDQWKDAWSDCLEREEYSLFCLRKKDKPSCKPEDHHLRKYKDGILGYERERQSQQRRLIQKQNDASFVQLGDFNYVTTGLGLIMDVSVTNLNTKYLLSVSLDCEIRANGRYALYDGTVLLYGGVKPGQTNQLRLEFHHRNLAIKYKLKELSTRDMLEPVSSLDVMCRKSSANFSQL